MVPQRSNQVGNQVGSFSQGIPLVSYVILNLLALDRSDPKANYIGLIGVRKQSSHDV